MPPDLPPKVIPQSLTESKYECMSACNARSKDNEYCYASKEQQEDILLGR